MTFAKWQNLPFAEVPRQDRVSSKAVAICRGGCNKIARIDNPTYQLCSGCSNKWRYHGYSCDVPNCESEADGTIIFNKKENKMICHSCYMAWSRMDYCIWERLVESRHLVLLRPKTFVKALEEGIISPIEKENRFNQSEVAECQHCNRESQISSLIYQLCVTCTKHLQYYGETCGVCEINDAMGFDNSESIFVCGPCRQIKQKYNITSYQIYKTQIRTILNCQFCNKSVSHDKENGNKLKSACIDHDHDTGITRGVLCSICNSNEGKLKKWAEDLNTDLLGVIELLKS